MGEVEVLAASVDIAEGSGGCEGIENAEENVYLIIRKVQRVLNSLYSIVKRFKVSALGKYVVDIIMPAFGSLGVCRIVEGGIGQVEEGVEHGVADFLFLIEVCNIREILLLGDKSFAVFHFILGQTVIGKKNIMNTEEILDFWIFVIDGLSGNGLVFICDNRNGVFRYSSTTAGSKTAAPYMAGYVKLEADIQRLTRCVELNTFFYAASFLNACKT